MRGDDGAALVEGAIVAPIIVFLVFGLLELSMLLQTHLAVRAAVNDAAREVSLSSNGDQVDQAAVNQLLRRSAGTVSADLESIVIYSPDSVGDAPAVACRTGGSSATCQSFTGEEAEAGSISCGSTLCSGSRDDDSLVGIWVRVRYNSVTGLLPDSIITAQHVQRVSPAAGVGG